MDSIAVLDFGSQYSQLIVRRVRELRVYCELFPFDAPAEQLRAFQPKGFILSGGPASVYQAGAPQLPRHVLESGLPILGICYGMQALTHALGGRVAASQAREYGPSQIEVNRESRLLPQGSHSVWMSHGDRIEAPPSGFISIAHSENSPVAAIQDEAQRRFGLQFHPEVRHTPAGSEILRRFVVTGLLRLGECESVDAAMRAVLGGQWRLVDASREFLSGLAGVTDPEDKRRIVGEQFIRTFEAHAQQVGSPEFLVQGTIYPDVVESRGPERQQAARIK